MRSDFLMALVNWPDISVYVHFILLTAWDPDTR